MLQDHVDLKQPASVGSQHRSQLIVLKLNKAECDVFMLMMMFLLTSFIIIPKTEAGFYTRLLGPEARLVPGLRQQGVVVWWLLSGAADLLLGRTRRRAAELWMTPPPPQMNSM